MLGSVRRFGEDPDVEVAGQREDESAAVASSEDDVVESAVSRAPESQVSSAASFARSMAPRTNRLAMTTRAPMCATRHHRVVGSVVVAA